MRNLFIFSGRVEKYRKPKSQRAASKFDVGRTVVLKNLPECITEKKILKKCINFGTVKSVSFPVAGREVPTAFVTFQEYKEAKKAVCSLNGTNYKGATLEAVLLSKEGKQVSKKTLKKSRLIVRNLSFKCSEDDVKKAFSHFGQVIEVHIPRKANGAMLGYGFVQFASYMAASRAVEGMNAQELNGRPVAVDWVVPKKKFEESLKQEREDGLGEQGGVEKGSQNDKIDSEKEERMSDSTIEGGGEDGFDSEMSSSGDDDEEMEKGERSSEEEKVEVGKQIKRPVLKPDTQEGRTVFIRYTQNTSTCVLYSVFVHTPWTDLS